jgi:hypothetical protein
VRHFVANRGIEVALELPHERLLFSRSRRAAGPCKTGHISEITIMASTTHQARHSDPTAEAKPDYRTHSSANADEPRDCHSVKPPAAPGSAAENHEDANQKCVVPTDSVQPQTASKDQREKATG